MSITTAAAPKTALAARPTFKKRYNHYCLLYTSDAADE